ncbi:TonB-dependent siderophore receptor [Siphonobacter sp. SORGH_AS_0500]|nr:TonB-dependent siderophore receptor [Siphonobacter sp. SORGH_AS_0500]PKK35634.1 TonB-dependent siderophore receptor [Siphonobacter sp. SORGH_AS_0500]
MAVRFLHTSFLLLLSICAFAQNGKITGQVLTSDNKPAFSVTVSLKGRAIGAMTDEQGNFTIPKVRAGKYTLVASFVGLKSQEQAIEVLENETTTVSFMLHESSNELQEVVVRSAQNPYHSNQVSSTLRISEPILEAPQNIQVITGKVLGIQQITSLSDGLIRNVSGATRLEHWGDTYARVNMRGSRASAFRNGMNITSTWGPLTEDMSFVDHIEFVKGPAGFMMSNGEPAGMYNVVTKRPTGVTKGEASLLLGSYDFYRTSLDLDGKFSDKVLYRFNVMGQTKNSFRPYEYNNRFSIAPVITYKLDDKTTLTTEYVYQHAKMSNVGSYYVFAKDGYAVLPRNFTLSDPGLEPTNIDDHNLTVNLQHQLNDRWKLTAQVAYFNYMQKGSSMWPAYGVGEPDAAGNIIRSVSLWDASNVSKFGQLFLNGEEQTGKVHHRILAGLDLGSKQYLADWNQSHNLDTSKSFNIYRPTYGSPANGYPNFDRSKPLAERAGIYGTLSQSYTGLYLQDELGFFENRLRLTIAGRFTYAKDNQYNTITSDKKVTPRFGLSGSIDKNTSVYALYDQTFLPQTGILRSGGRIKPISGNNLEVGFKRDWFGGKWNTTLAIYRILKNNQLSPDPSNAAGQNFVLQLGQTQTQGIEFDLRGEIAPGLSLIANYALTDSKVTKETSDAKVGDKIPGYAKHNANAWVTYKIQKGVLKGTGFSAGFNYQGNRTTWNWSATSYGELPNYFKLDGGIYWENDRFNVTANVFNVLDTYLYTGAAYGTYYYWQAEPGRNSRIGVTYKF